MNRMKQLRDDDENQENESNIKRTENKYIEDYLKRI